MKWEEIAGTPFETENVSEKDVAGVFVEFFSGKDIVVSWAAVGLHGTDWVGLTQTEKSVLERAAKKYVDERFDTQCNRQISVVFHAGNPKNGVIVVRGESEIDRSEIDLETFAAMANAAMSLDAEKALGEAGKQFVLAASHVVARVAWDHKRLDGLYRENVMSRCETSRVAEHSSTEGDGWDTQVARALLSEKGHTRIRSFSVDASREPKFHVDGVEDDSKTDFAAFAESIPPARGTVCVVTDSTTGKWYTVSFGASHPFGLVQAMVDAEAEVAWDALSLHDKRWMSMTSMRSDGHRLSLLFDSHAW